MNVGLQLLILFLQDFCKVQVKPSGFRLEKSKNGGFTDSENASNIFVQTTQEEVENRGFTLKRIKCFRPHYGGEILKRRFH